VRQRREGAAEGAGAARDRSGALGNVLVEALLERASASIAERLAATKHHVRCRHRGADADHGNVPVGGHTQHETEI